ncbi:MAG: DNA recombination protein RmuC [Patescibacteria group bacterium]|nr:DNA recombination protein RmuC [Patescibacteria group bacterium]
MLDLFNIIIGIALVIIFYFLWNLNKKLEPKNHQPENNFLDLSNKIIEGFNHLRQELLHSLQITIQKQERFVESSSKLEELSRALESSAIEIKTFKEILAGPKNRGQFGEIMLEEIIKTLPYSFYEKQYQLGTERVDYVLKLNDVIIPIDAKFPIQNFQNLFNSSQEKDIIQIKRELIRNLKYKIDDISKKYILPSKGTVEFAIMYLANESLYYELLSDKDFQEVWDFAREKAVFISSPKNFEFVCSSLLLVLRKQELSKNIQQIISQLSQLEKDLFELESKLKTSQTQLNNSFRNLEDLSKTLNRFITNFKFLTKIDRAEIEIERAKERSLIN